MPFMIPAESVQLEAALREPASAPWAAAVVCHPHPVYGGTMDNRVVYRAAKAAVREGIAALRFNFRGVGESTGQFDQGIGEKEDVIAALRWLGNRYPDLPLALIGYSFGAWVGLQAGQPCPGVKALVGIAPPLDLFDFEFLCRNPKPSLYIIGTRDNYCSWENMDRLERCLPEASSLQRVDGAEHSFEGHLEEMESQIADFFGALVLDRGAI